MGLAALRLDLLVFQFLLGAGDGDGRSGLDLVGVAAAGDFDAHVQVERAGLEIARRPLRRLGPNPLAVAHDGNNTECRGRERDGRFRRDDAASQRHGGAAKRCPQPKFQEGAAVHDEAIHGGWLGFGPMRERSRPAGGTYWHPLRHRLDFTAAVDHGQGGLARGQQLVATEEFVAVLDLGRGDADHRGAEPQEVVVAGRAMEMAPGLHDHHQQTVGLHLPIIAAGGPKQLGPSDLKVGKIAGVMEETHRVGLLIPHPKLDFVLFERGHGFPNTLLGRIVEQCGFPRGAWEPGTNVAGSPSMAFDQSAGTGTDFATMRGRNYPAIRQFTVFLENKVGKLLEVIRRFEGSRVRIVALSISDTAECAFVRFLLSHPEQGREILERAGLAIVESDLIGVELPEGHQALLDICTALLQAEVNIIQAYPLLVRPRGQAAVALMVDNIEIAQETLAAKGFSMVTEADLQEEE